MPLSGAHNVGDTGHTTDHNLIDTAIGALQAADTAETAARVAADALKLDASTASATYVASSSVRNIVQITQAAYDELTPKVATTLYVIVG